MTAETTPKSPEVKPLDFSKIDDLFKKLGTQEVGTDFRVARTELADGTFIQIIRDKHLINYLSNKEDEEVVIQVNVGSSSYAHELQFELAESGLRSLRRSSVDTGREPFAFDISIGDTQVGRWWIHDKKATLELRWISNPLRPREEEHIKA